MIKKILFPVISAAALIAVDYISKLYAVIYLKDRGSIVLIPGVFELTYSENRGMAFGMLQGGKWLFLAITVIVLAGLIYLYTRIPAGKRYLPLRIIDVFICSGAIGNMIDRICRGYVVDFLYIKLIDFPIFNIADCYVTWCAVLLLILLIFKYKEGEFTSKKTAAADAEGKNNG